MPTEELKKQLQKVESISTVQDGKMINEDFYNYLAAFEGKKVRWTLELATPSTQSL